MKLQRRTLLMTGAAVAAAAAGAWMSWRRIAPQPVLSGAEAAFWAGHFDGPNGEAVNLVAMRGRPLLVNFWATWCPPCVEELPLLNAFNTANAAQGWQVLGLAVDQPSAVRGFLKKLPLNFPVGMAPQRQPAVHRGVRCRGHGLAPQDRQGVRGRPGAMGAAGLSRRSGDLPPVHCPEASLIKG